MPSKSEKQQRAMGMAYAAKTGKLDPSKLSPKLRKMMNNMSAKQLKEFAETKHDNIKKKASIYSFLIRSLT